MVNFDKIIEMIELICTSDYYSNKTFNEFAIEFFLETRTIPLSKFLRLRGYSNKMPKIMNLRKAGEVLYQSNSSEEIKNFIFSSGFKEVPQLNYSAIMVLRKTTLEKNWKKLSEYLNGQGTIDDINKRNQVSLLPEEVEKIENYIKQELGLTSGELQWFKEKTKKLFNNKKTLNSLKKII